jgi:hypothetical protein
VPAPAAVEGGPYLSECRRRDCNSCHTLIGSHSAGRQGSCGDWATTSAEERERYESRLSADYFRSPQLLSVGAVVVTAVGLGASAASSPKTDSASCLTQGARDIGGKRSTTTYSIEQIRGVTCSFARPWVTRMTYRHLPKSTQAPSGGPPGWYCASQDPGLAYSGGCAKTGGYFTWRPKFAPPDPNANLRVYDMRVVGSGTISFKSGGHGSARWSQTVLGVRIRVQRVTLIGGAHLIYLFAPRRSGTESTSYDWSPDQAAVLRCPEHDAHSVQFEGSAGASGANSPVEG